MTQRSRSPMRRMLLAVVLSVFVVGLSAPALATYHHPEAPEIQPERIERGVQSEGVAPQRVQPAPGPLAVTGAELTLFVLLGIGLAGAGVLIVRATRRRRQAA